MKKFFAKIGSAIKTFFVSIWHAIGRGLYAFNHTKPMLAIGHVLSAPSRFLTSRLSYRTRQKLWGFVFVLPLVIGLIYFFIIPFFTTIIYSFSNVRNLGTSPSNVFLGVSTEWIGWDNYIYALNEHTTFKKTLLSSFGQILVQVPLILIFSLLMAVVLNGKFRGRAFVRAIFFMPVIFNSTAVEQAMSTGSSMIDAVEGSGQDVFSSAFNFKDFLTNANLPLTLVNFLSSAASSIYDIISYSGVQIMIFLAAIQSVPNQLYEAAKMEGATQYEIFWKITFPMVTPMMLPAGVYTVVDALLRSDITKTLKTFTTTGARTMATGLGEVSYYGIHAAMSWLFALVSILVIALVVLILSRMVFYYDK